MENPLDPVAIFEAISHDRRIKILQFLAKSPATFTEIKRMLKISSNGNLTHHLSKLVSLIKKDSSGNYQLAKSGRESLLIIEIAKKSKRKVIQETYTWFSAAIFYSFYITIAYYTSNNFWASPLIGIALSLCYYIIITLIIKTKVRKGDWLFLFGRNK